MTDTTTTDAAPKVVVDRYLEFWNAAPDDQLRLAPSTFAAGINYTTPVGLMSGVEALVDFKRQLAEHLGSFRFVAREEPQAHHHLVRLPWDIVTADGTSFATGTDVIECDDAGTIRAVSGFLDRAPEGFDYTQG